MSRIDTHFSKVSDLHCSRVMFWSAARLAVVGCLVFVLGCGQSDEKEATESDPAALSISSGQNEISLPAITPTVEIIRGVWVAGDYSAEVTGPIDSAQRNAILRHSFRLQFIDQSRVRIFEGATAPVGAVWRLISDYSNQHRLRIDLPDGETKVFSIVFRDNNHFVATPVGEDENESTTFSRLSS